MLNDPLNWNYNIRMMYNKMCLNIHGIIYCKQDLATLARWYKKIIIFSAINLQDYQDEKNLQDCKIYLARHA